MKKPELEVLWGGAVWDILLPPGQAQVARDGKVKVQFEQYDEEEYTVPLHTIRMRSEGCEEEQCSAVEEGMRVLAYTTHPRPNKLVEGQAHYEGVVTSIQRKPHSPSCACVFQVRLFDMGRKWNPKMRRSPPLLSKPQTVSIQDLALVAAPLTPLNELVNAILANNRAKLRELWGEAGGEAWWRHALKYDSRKPFDWSGAQQLASERQGEEGEEGEEDSSSEEAEDDEIQEVIPQSPPVAVPSASGEVAEPVSPLPASGTPSADTQGRTTTPGAATVASRAEDRPRSTGQSKGTGAERGGRASPSRKGITPRRQPRLSAVECDRAVILALPFLGPRAGQCAQPSARQGMEREAGTASESEGEAHQAAALLPEGLDAEAPRPSAEAQEAQGAGETRLETAMAGDPGGDGAPVASPSVRVEGVGGAEVAPRVGSPVAVRRVTVARRGGKGGATGARPGGSAVRQEAPHEAAGVEATRVGTASSPLPGYTTSGTPQVAAAGASAAVGSNGRITGDLAARDEDGQGLGVEEASEPRARGRPLSESPELPDSRAYAADEVLLGSGLAVPGHAQGVPGAPNGGPLPQGKKRTRVARDADEDSSGEEGEEWEVGHRQSWAGGEGAEEEEGESDRSAADGAAASEAPVLGALQVSLRRLRTEPAANAMVRARIKALLVPVASFHVWNSRDPKLTVEEAFAHQFLPSTKTELTLRDEIGKQWAVTWAPRTCAFRADWEGFGAKHRLKQGSVVLLEVVGDNHHPRLKAHLFRANTKSD